MKIIQPDNWQPPKGYSNGIVAEGKFLSIAGQIGWDGSGQFASNDLVGQTKQTLTNIITILEKAGGKPEHLVRLTWYILDKSDYLKNAKGIGEVYRDILGKHYPAMSLVVVKGLLEDKALVEIEATAVIP